VIAGAAAAIILAILGLVHVYWAAGGALGKSSAIPTRDGKQIFTPSPFTTILVALGLFSMAALSAIKMGWIAAPGMAKFTRPGLWVAAAIFLLRAIGDFRYLGFFKRLRNGRFAKLDTMVYAPICLLLACLLAISASS
jgi:hypothetical protein